MELWLRDMAVFRLSPGWKVASKKLRGLLAYFGLTVSGARLVTWIPALPPSSS